MMSLSCGLAGVRVWLTALSLATVMMSQAAEPVFVAETTALPNVWMASVSLADYDNDGLLDVLISGSDQEGGHAMTRLYHNDGNFSFTEVAAGLPQLFSAMAAWGDLNNDGRVDLVLSGYSGPPTVSEPTKVCMNKGDQTFDLMAVSLPGPAGYPSVSLADENRDGYLDLLVANTDSGRTVQLFRNQGGLTFARVDVDLGGAVFATWGDLNKDGFPDILAASMETWTLARVFKNNGDGTFRNIAASLEGVADGAHGGWGDYDNDGREDILLTGWTGAGNSRILRIYHNDGNDVFTAAVTTLPGTDRMPTARWGDYDVDGKLDVLVTGFYLDQVGPISRVFHNDGGGQLKCSPKLGPVA